MPPTGPNARRGGPPTLRGSSARMPAGARPTDLNDRGFLDKFASDIGSLLWNLPRAAVNLVGAPVSDVVSLLPGGREASTFGTATGTLAKDLATSVGRTGVELAGSVGGLTNLPVVGDDIAAKFDEGLRQYGGLGTGAADIIAAERELKSEHPGLALVEDVGNIALMGGAAGKALGAGATRAAGVSTKGMNRAAKRAALEEIANSAGPGSKLASTSLGASDMIAHPYRAATQGLVDVKVGGRHSLREVAQQVRETIPADRMPWSPEMRDAAKLRRLRGEVDALADAGEEAALLRATSALEEFETANADRLPTLEETRLAPRPIEELTSPAARSIRETLNVEGLKNFTEPFVKAKRTVRGQVQELREAKIDSSLDTLTIRDPNARRTLAIRQLRDLDRAEGGPLNPRERLTPMDDAALLARLNEVAADPEIRAKLPRLESTLDLTRLDLYERVNDLPEGAIRNQLYDDAVLTPKIANTVRELQRRGEQLPEEVRTVVEDALGRSWRIPDEHLANPISAHPDIADAYANALRQFTTEAADRDVTLARHGLGDVERWALRVAPDENAPGGVRAMTPDESPELGVSPSSQQARRLGKARQQVTAARSRVEKISDQAKAGRWAVRGGVFDNYRALKQQATQLARQLGEAKVSAGAEGQALLGELEGIVEQVGRTIEDAGYKLDDVTAGKYAELVNTAELGTHAEVRAIATEVDAAGRTIENNLAKAQGRAQARQLELDRAVRAYDRVEAAFTAVEAEVLSSIEAAPAVARPVLAVGRALRKVDKALREADLSDLADDLKLSELPTTLDEMRAAGVSPTFLRQLEERAAAIGYRSASEQPVKAPTMGAQRRRSMADVEIRRDVDRVKAEADIELANRVLTGQFLNEFESKFGRSRHEVAEVLFEDPNVSLNREAWRSMSKHQQEKLLQDLGYVAYEPESIFAFRVRKTAEDATWIPTYLRDGLTEYLKQGPMERVLASVVAPATTTWKHFVLALRPAWQVYNLVGNMAMATVAGRMPARDYLEFMKPGSEAYQLLRAHRMGLDLEQSFGLTPDLATDLLDSGLSRDLAPEGRTRAKLSDALVNHEGVKRALDTNLGQRAGNVKAGFDATVGGSYRVNAFLDNLNRASLFLYDTVKQGMDPEEAVRHANRTLGEYRRMSHAEKVYVRSVFPFYAWMRHITRLSFDMLKPDNITRTATIGTLVHTLGEPRGVEEFFPDYMAGDVAIGDTGMVLGLGGFNPWRDVLGSIVHNEEASLRGLTGSMHPGIQFGMERTTGVDTLTGRPFTRPVPVLDDYGRELPTPPDLLTHARKRFAPPQVQLLLDTYRKATGQPTARYGNDEPVLMEGAQGRSLASGVGSFLGAPIRSVDAEGIEERRSAAMDRVSRQIARYQAEVDAYQQQRQQRSTLERLLPFGG